MLLETQEQNAPTPPQILQQAVERGMDADQLEKIMGLQERWERNQAERAYNEAMALCQAEMPAVVADAVNPDTRSKYPRFESIQSIAKPIYNRHGFSLSFGDAENCAFGDGWKRIVCDCLHAAGHSKRYDINLPIDGIGAKGNPIGGMNRVQGCVSTNSYGQRVLTCNIFNITIAGKDRDGRSANRISDKHIVAINDLLEQIPDGFAPFLKYMGVESLADISMSDYGKAMNALKKKVESLQ